MVEFNPSAVPVTVNGRYRQCSEAHVSICQKTTWRSTSIQFSNGKFVVTIRIWRWQAVLMMSNGDAA